MKANTLLTELQAVITKNSQAHNGRVFLPIDTEFENLMKEIKGELDLLESMEQNALEEALLS
jgi:hypothetical protein